jgi:hypothetical protein
MSLAKGAVFKHKEITMPPSTNGSRKVNGQFSEGNKYGRGNPHAQKVAQLRTALIESITPEDIKEIAATLLTQAKAGDINSCKFLLPYLVGTAPQPCNPDEIELQEMQLHAKLKQEESLEKLRALTDRF